MNSIKETVKYLPCFACGKVVKGFGRGSKQLGCPTANYADNLVSQLPSFFQYGVYYGWAKVDNGPVHKMVMSVGTNPTFQNPVKTMETHLLHKFEEDFYGSVLKVIILGYMRQMMTFTNIDELKSAINKDIDQAKIILEFEENAQYKTNPFFNHGGEKSFIHSTNNNNDNWLTVSSDDQFILLKKLNTINGYNSDIQ